MKRYKLEAIDIYSGVVTSNVSIESIESNGGGWVEWKDAERVMIENKELKVKNKRLIQIINQERIKEE